MSEPHRVLSFDGTELATYRVGASGPWMVLANGLGGNLKAWRHLVDDFEPTHRILTWDYRGLYASGPPASGGVDVPTQARDLLAVLDDAGVESAVCVGWSMGVQVLLELQRLAPDRIGALVLLGGVSGRPFDRVLGGGSLAAYVRPFLERLQRVEPYARDMTRAAADLPWLVTALRLTGLFSQSVDEELLRELVGDVLRLDHALYLRTLEALGDHDASDILPSITAPTLVVVGDRDLFQSVADARGMQEAIPAAELLVVRDGTHYAPIEHPRLINLRIRKLLRDHGRTGGP